MIGRESPSSMRLASVHILNVTAWKMSHCWKFSWNIPPFLQNKQITEMRMDGQIEAWWKYSAKHHACCWGWNIIDFFLGFCTLYNTTNYLSVAMMICFLAFEIHNIMVLMSDFKNRFDQFLQFYKTDNIDFTNMYLYITCSSEGIHICAAMFCMYMLCKLWMEIELHSLLNYLKIRELWFSIV